MNDSAAGAIVSVTGSDVARLVECSEASAYAGLLEVAPAELKERYGLAVHQFGLAHAFVAARYSESLLLNRVIGLGVGGPASVEVLDAVDQLYRANGVSTYAIELGPLVTPADLTRQLRERGFLPFKKTGMLFRRAEMIAGRHSSLQLRRAERKEAKVFASLCCEIFGLGEPFPGILSATFDSPDWQQWLAFDECRPVAGAITHVNKDVAWVGWAGTLPSHRGRGAQTALAAAQLHEASGRNVRWVTLEAAVARGGPSQSFRNYIRLGWTPAYDRTVYLRKAEPSGGAPQ